MRKHVSWLIHHHFSMGYSLVMSASLNCSFIRPHRLFSLIRSINGWSEEKLNTFLSHTSAKLTSLWGRPYNASKFKSFPFRRSLHVNRWRACFLLISSIRASMITSLYPSIHKCPESTVPCPSWWKWVKPPFIREMLVIAEKTSVWKIMQVNSPGGQSINLVP